MSLQGVACFLSVFYALTKEAPLVGDSGLVGAVQTQERRESGHDLSHFERRAGVAGQSQRPSLGRALI